MHTCDLVFGSPKSSEVFTSLKFGKVRIKQEVGLYVSGVTPGCDTELRFQGSLYIHKEHAIISRLGVFGESNTETGRYRLPSGVLGLSEPETLEISR